MTSNHHSDLPLCPLSAHCARFLDDLDQQSPSWHEPLSDPHEARLLEQLRAHLPLCPTCNQALLVARRERTQLRAALRDALSASERRVPSTVELILAELRAGQMLGGQSAELAALPPLLAENNHHHLVSPQLLRTARLAGRSRSTFSTLLSIAAVAAVVLLSAGIFGGLVMLRTNTFANQPTQKPGVAQNWNEMLIQQPSAAGNGTQVINNYEPFSGTRHALPGLCCNLSSSIDSISHDGHDLLYHSFVGGKTHYHILTHEFAAFNCRCGSASAVWTTDDRAVFIDTQQQLVQVEVASGRQHEITSAPLQSSSLVSYINGYLYFNRDETTQKSQLLRLNVETGDEQSVVSRTLPGPDGYWPSPDGTKIYYAEELNGASAVYMVESDGRNPHLLRAGGLPIGFAGDGSLLFLTQDRQTFHVMKLGAGPQSDQQVLADAAPNARTIQVNGVALAPQGSSLVVEALNADNSVSIWADNLLNGSRRQLLRFPASGPTASVQLLGWNRLPTSRQSPTPTPDLTPSVNALSSPGWDGLLVAKSSKASSISLLNYNSLNSHVASASFAALAAGAQSDGISPDGLSLAYHLIQKGQTLYYVASLAAVAAPPRLYYSSADSGSNAVWMTGHSLLVNTARGIVEVNIQTLVQTVVMASLDTPRLTFYYDPYLYFIGGANRVTDALYRIRLGSGLPLQQVSLPSPGSTFWLSPNGRVIYYVNQGPAAAKGIYAVNLDSNATSQLISYPLRPSGVPVGYAEDNSLMILRQQRGRFELVQLGLTPSLDRVLMADVAQGATSLCSLGTIPAGTSPICDSDVAMAPYGHSLVVQVYAKDGSHRVLAYNFESGAHLVLLSATSQIRVSLLGWDQAPPP